MSKSLKARCIRRWEVRTKSWCDSKWSEVWRKRDQRRFFRETAIITAGCMVDELAYNNAMHDFFTKNGDDKGWCTEFSTWYNDKRQEQYLKEAFDFLDEEATTDEIDEQIENELEAWND